MATQVAEGLVERVQRLSEAADPAAQELVSGVMALYGEGLARIVDVLLEAGDAAAGIRAQLLDDGVVASLLLIHDLYPLSLEDRVAEALDSVRPYMESHGGGVEMLGISEEGFLRLRLQGSCDGCPASAATLELAIKEALEEAAPDLAGLEVEGVVAPVKRAPQPARLTPTAPPAMTNAAVEPTGLALPMVKVGETAPAPASSRRAAEPGWRLVPELEGLGRGTLAAVEVSGARLVAARVGTALLAYRDACAACGSPLGAGELKDGLLTCPGCAAAYSLAMAGRAFDGAGPPLDPVPLLEDPVRVSLGS